MTLLLAGMHDASSARALQILHCHALLFKTDLESNLNLQLSLQLMSLFALSEGPILIECILQLHRRQLTLCGRSTAIL